MKPYLDLGYNCNTPFLELVLNSLMLSERTDYLSSPSEGVNKAKAYRAGSVFIRLEHYFYENLKIFRMLVLQK